MLIINCCSSKTTLNVIPQANNSVVVCVCVGGVYIGITMSVRLSVHMSRHCNISSTDESILTKLYTIIVNDLKMCMKEDNPSPNYFKGNNEKYETGRGYHFVIGLLYSSSSQWIGLMLYDTHVLMCYRYKYCLIQNQTKILRWCSDVPNKSDILEIIQVVVVRGCKIVSTLISSTCILGWLLRDLQRWQTISCQHTTRGKCIAWIRWEHDAWYPWIQKLRQNFQHHNL